MGGRGAYSMTLKRIRDDAIQEFKEIEPGAIPGIKIVVALNGNNRLMPYYSKTSEVYAVKGKKGEIIHARLFDKENHAPVYELDFNQPEKGYKNKKLHIHEFSPLTSTEHPARSDGRDLTERDYANPRIQDVIRKINAYNSKYGV